MRWVLSAILCVAASSAALGCSTSALAPEPAESADDVVMRKCPARINAALGGLDAYSYAEIAQRSGFELNQSDRDELRDPLRRLEEDIYRFETSLILEKAENAQCFYKPATPDAQKVTAKFYTKAGKNVLRIDAKEGDAKDLSFYVTVKSYSKEALTLSYPSAAIFFRAQDSEAAFRPVNIGRSREVAVGVAEPGPAQPLSDDALEAALKEAVAGVTFTSEADAEFDVFRAPIAANEAVSAATVKKKFNGLPNTNEEGTQLKDLIGQDEGKFSEFLSAETLIGDPTGDEDDQKYASAMRAVHVLMSSGLTDLKVVYVASSSLEDSHDVGWVQIFIVGRSPSGTLFAVHTGAAWT